MFTLSVKQASFLFLLFISMTLKVYGKEHITITFSSDMANVDLGNAPDSDIQFTIDGAHVVLTNTNTSEEMEFELKGTSTDGSFTYNGEYKSTIILNNLNLTSKKGAALDIEDGKRIALILTNGTQNTLIDATGGNQKAALYCKGHLEISGNGNLDVTGNTYHGIATKEYMLLKKSTGKITISKAAKDGIHAGQYFQMNGGTINLSGMIDDGIQAESSKDSTKVRNGWVYIKGGNINIDIESNDTKGIKSDSLFVVTGGAFVINVRGAGSKGISSGTDMVINPYGAAIKMNINVSGLQYTDPITKERSKCMGIKVQRDLAIEDGDITVKTTYSTSKDIKVGRSYYHTGGAINALVDCTSKVYYERGTVSMVIDTTRIYGEENPEFQYTKGGKRYNGTTLFCKATETSPAGEYSITSDRYSIFRIDGILNIKRAPLSIKAKDYTIRQGETLPTFDVEYNGFKNGENNIVLNKQPKVNCNATSASAPGTYDINVSSAESKNYDITYIKGTLTITKGDRTVVTAKSYTRFYGDPNPKFEYTIDEGELEKEPEIICDATSASPVGVYPIIIRPKSSEDSNCIYVNGTLNIVPAPLIAFVNDAYRAYGDRNPDFTIFYSGFVNNENESVLSAKPQATTNATPKSIVGDYPINLNGGKARNYDFSYKQGMLTVVKAPLLAKVNDETKTYGNHNPTFTIKFDGLKNGEIVPDWAEKPTIQTEATQTSDVGEYTIEASGVPQNYDLKKITPGTLTVTPASLTIKANDKSRLYYSEEPSYDFTYSGFVNKENEQVLMEQPVIETEATKTSNVGQYIITPKNAIAKNYTISYIPGILTIEKRTLTATAPNTQREYGEDNPTLTLSYSGFVNNENENIFIEMPIAFTSATRTSNAGKYHIDITEGIISNYEVDYIPGTLTVTKAPLAVKVKDATKVYGAQNPTFTMSYEGLKNGETAPAWYSPPSIQTKATKFSDVGEYAIQANGGVAVNYNIEITDGTLNVTPASLTVRVHDTTRLYYEEEPDFNYTYSGFVNGDGENALSARPSLSTTATKLSDVGEYDILASGANSHNYIISYINGTLKVKPRTLIATTGNYERTYNEENPAFKIVYDGFVANENESVLTTKPTAKTTAAKTSDVGSYKIDVMGGDAKNYTFSYVPGILTINKAEQSIDWNQDLEGLRIGDQIELKASATSGLPVFYSIEDKETAEIYVAGTKYWLDCKAEGETQIVAVQEGNHNYYASRRVRKPLIVGPAAINETRDESFVKVQSTTSGIIVTGARLGETIHIYTIEGMLQKSVKVEEQPIYIQMKQNNIYIVKVGEKVIKLKH